MVWPSLNYYQTFAGVIKNYTDAASINNSILLPVGEVWKDYFEAMFSYPLYAPYEMLNHKHIKLVEFGKCTNFESCNMNPNVIDCLNGILKKLDNKIDFGGYTDEQKGTLKENLNDVLRVQAEHANLKGEVREEEYKTNMATICNRYSQEIQDYYKIEKNPPVLDGKSYQLGLLIMWAELISYKDIRDEKVLDIDQKNEILRKNLFIQYRTKTIENKGKSVEKVPGYDKFFKDLPDLFRPDNANQKKSRYVFVLLDTIQSAILSEKFDKRQGLDFLQQNLLSGIANLDGLIGDNNNNPGLIDGNNNDQGLLKKVQRVLI